MVLTTLEKNRNAVNLLWQKKIINAREISQRTGVPLRSCERYISLLKKTGKIAIGHRSGRPRKLTPKKRRQIGMIVKHNHFTTASEIKAQLEEKNPELEVVFSAIQMFCNTLTAWSRDARPIAPMVKHPFKVHIWGAISVKGKIGMHMFTENLDRHLYRQILNEHLYDNANAIHGRRWVFQLGMGTLGSRDFERLLSRRYI
ncbi:hypothetical protein C1646_668989 [Rhizophagus diaphanus]|nr:hypothetical protein C1646_668989 [Rhizophagus diaphanus] [Rhizophagus sp. MUCL 43196]